jgi:hypothetical protein
MKKWVYLVLVTTIGGSLFWDFLDISTETKAFVSSKNFSGEIHPQSFQAVASGISPEISSLAPASPDMTQTNKKTADEKARQVPNNLPFRKQIEGAVQDTESNFAVISGSSMPSPSLAFEGLNSNDNAAAYGFRIIPPDTFGDVGFNHYVQVVNSLVRIFDKNGNPLTPPFKLSSIFAPLGTPCATRNDGDPIVLFDALADRWLLSQFCTQSPPFRQMIAVSKTGNPLGEYYIYEFVMPNNKLNDYSKIGVWTDAYYMSTDEFFGSDYAGSGAFAFDKQKLLAGDPTAGYIYFDLASPTTLRIGGLLPTDFDGLRPPPVNAPNIFVGYTATEYGEAQDAIRLFNFHADFSNPNNSTFNERSESPLTVSPFDPTSPAGRDDIAQPTPGEKLDSQSDRLMYRVGYRNFGTFESLVFNQTVRTTPLDQIYRAGIRVYELRKSGGGFSVNESATVGDNNISRFMGSAAQDHQGNLAIGYSTSNEDKKPAIIYTGKLATEPVGTFRIEKPLIEGTGVQKAFGFRWGDYSAMSIDPTDDCTFWLTNEYFTFESQEESDFGWLTRIGKFKFEECANAPRANINGTITNASNGQPIENAAVTASAFSRSTNVNGNYGNLTVLPNTYNLTATAHGFRSQTVQVTIADGQTLAQNFALQPTAVFENPNLNITAESCTPNNSIDPGENVSVDIGLTNSGQANTANLVATLLPTGGVTNPSQPQNYGAISMGNSATRAFSFTASPNLTCGGTISLSLQLQDGAENLGMVTINLLTGRPRVAFSEDFDGNPLPDLPTSWTTSATGAQQIWRTREERFESPPNSAFSPDPNQIGLNEMISPMIQITSPNAEIRFRNWYELETTFLRNRLYDGAVLEIKIGANNWQDIETSGGRFLQGGYDGVIDSCCQNPLMGRRGWSGRSGIETTSTWITSKAKLPTSAAGQNVQFRWRVGTDIGTFREGQYIDDIVVTDGFVCGCQIAPSRAPFDFDGDGKTDLSVFRPSDSPSEADFFIQNSSNNSSNNAAWGSVGDLAANADYDGDGKTDLAVFRPSTRTWFILQSSNSSILALNFGLADDKISPADYDGDSKADIAVYRPSAGVWYILQSSDGETRIQQFGLAEDIPVPADFDGDNKTDIAVWRGSTGIWYVSKSSDGNAIIAQFGLNGDKPVVGNFDGDGKADFVVYRPSERLWYLLRTAQGFGVVQFGLNEDRPLQADFDSDGKRDIAVFRPSTNVWYYLKSSDNSFVAIPFGQNGDTAIPAIFVP